MRAATRTTLALGDLLEIPVGLCPAVGDDDPKLETATLDGFKRVQFYAHPDDVVLAHDGKDTDLEFSVLRPQASVEVVATGQRLHAYEPLQPDEIQKGIIASGDNGPEFRPIPGDELAALKEGAKLERVELAEFIDYRKVPTDRLQGSYYVQCDPGFARPLGSLMAAMRKANKAAVVRFAIRDRHRLGVLRVRQVSPQKYVLLLNIVVFAAQWREPDERVLEAGDAMSQASDRTIDQALRLMEELTIDGEGNVLKTATDAYPEDLRTLIKRAEDGEFAAVPPPSKTPVAEEAQASTPSRA